jgi:hypothetical protein
MYAYFDDVYLAPDPVKMSLARAASPSIFNKVGLGIGGGLGKIELILSPGFDPDDFLSRLGNFEGGSPHIVTGFSACFDVPRHASNGPHFIAAALGKLGTWHDRLLDLVEEVTKEDPFAALIFLQVCGVRRFGHVISSVPPHLVISFAQARDEAYMATFAAIQHEPPPAHSSHSLLVGAEGLHLRLSPDMRVDATLEPSSA